MNKNIKDYILTFDNLMPHDICNEIIKEYENCDEWKDSTIAENILEKKSRNCQNIMISSKEIIENNKNIRTKIDENIYKCISNVLSLYIKNFNTVLVSNDTGYDLLRYNTGNFYNEHIDYFSKQPRLLSCSINLNDNYTGGEFSFFNKEIIYSLKKGSAIIFPSNFMYPHSILPITKGTRYSIVTWFI